MERIGCTFLIFCFLFELFIIRMSTAAFWNLNGMTQCKLRMPATYYNEYGCYCGLGGTGTPVDGIDRCCEVHDQCYDRIMKSQVCPDVYTLPYAYVCSENEPVCNDEDECRSALCRCDKEVVGCWVNYPVPRDKAVCTKQSKSMLQEGNNNL